jgi:hypothetical protein
VNGKKLTDGAGQGGGDGQFIRKDKCDMLVILLPALGATPTPGMYAMGGLNGGNVPANEICRIVGSGGAIRLVARGLCS